MKIGKKYKVLYWGDWVEAKLVEGHGVDPMFDIEGEEGLTPFELVDKVGEEVEEKTDE